ncbi:alkaline phosphatase PhoX [Micromonospora rosaria]|uniref:alkaline phosphatase PhoX n=1 Tax=Micromonospora rosaria TaxID=47874 RepID=UPI001B7FF1E6|nr:alkaline phosphatase PhoX [Micromonospora rosaria]
MTLDRRRLLAQSGLVGMGVALAGAVDALFTADPTLAAGRGGYGDLVPDPAGLLDLPRGFRYTVLSREGDPIPGGAVAGNFDGMAAFAGTGREVRLVRNHEIWEPDSAPVVAPRALTFDPGPGAGGGVSTLVVGPHRVEQRINLGGTSTNCAGGLTPWRTWLSCEESEVRRGEGGHEKDHGWIFEVDPFRPARDEDPTPLTAMGRFAHEAVCVDPRTGVVYETEDSVGGDKHGCFYRFLPRRPLGGYGSLRAGGRLQVMRVPGVPDLSAVQEPGTTFRGVQWVDVPDPLATTEPVRLQDYGPRGVTHAQKLEGAWWGTDGAAYFVSSFALRSYGSAGDHLGQVWRYRPSTGALTLVVIFHGDPYTDLFTTPDNICMTPFGGLMLCQDGVGDSYLMGTTVDGEPYLFARNRQNIGTEASPEYGEFAGVCFSDDRRTMYVNCYEPGTTFAITGPFRR